MRINIICLERSITKYKTVAETLYLKIKIGLHDQIEQTVAFRNTSGNRLLIRMMLYKSIDFPLFVLHIYCAAAKTNI